MGKMKEIDMDMQNDGLSYTRKGDLVTIRMAGVDAVQEFEVLEWTDPDAPLYTELYHIRQTAYTFSTMMIKAHTWLREARAQVMRGDF